MVRLIYRDQTYELPAPITLAEALQRLGFNPLSYLAIRNGELIRPDVRLFAGDTVKLVATISGG